MNKNLRISLIIIFLILLFQTIFISKLETKISNQTQSQQTHYNNLDSNIYNINQQIQDTLNQELSKTHLIKEVTFKIEKPILLDTGYTLNVVAELSRLENGSSVIFMHRENGSSEWIQTQMDSNAPLSFICNIEVLSDKEYSYKVVTQAALSESGDISYLDKSMYMPYPPIVSGYGYDDKNLSIYVAEDVYTSNKSQYDIEKIEAIVISNGIEKYYKLSENKDINNMNEEKNYEVYIPKQDYKDGLDYIKMKVTYDNGIVDIVDITYQIGIENIYSEIIPKN